jgi:hypothetical protein
MNDEGLADAATANPFRLPRLHPGIRFGAPVDGGEEIDRDQVADMVREERPMAYGRFSDPREGDLC